MGTERHGLSVMSYDTAEKSYIYYETTTGAKTSIPTAPSTATPGPTNPR